MAALEKQNQQLSWQVAMLADRAAGAGKAADAKPRRPSPGSVPAAMQACYALLCAPCFTTHASDSKASTLSSVCRTQLA